MTKGFYKKQNGELLYCPTIIASLGYVLLAQDKDLYEYPVDGWSWFESEEDAIYKLSINVISPASNVDTIETT